MIWLYVAAALAVGYLLGRVKPAARASSWAHWLMYDRPTRRQAVWWLAQAVFLCEIAVMLVARPRDFVRAWKHRNDPPPPRGPAPVYDPEWAAKRQPRDGSAS